MFSEISLIKVQVLGCERRDDRGLRGAGSSAGFARASLGGGSASLGRLTAEIIKGSWPFEAPSE